MKKHTTGKIPSGPRRYDDPVKGMRPPVGSEIGHGCCHSVRLNPHRLDKELNRFTDPGGVKVPRR